MHDSLQTILAFVITITAIVFVHELGHYLVAKLSGIKVTDFSIGFGPKIVSKQDSSGTNWKISLIPLGGYVKFLGDLDSTSTKNTSIPDSEKKYAFCEKSLLIKSAVVLAGPAFNFIFGAIIFTVFFFSHGTLVSDTKIKNVSTNSPAHHAGLKPGDKILEIDKDEVKTFQDLASYVAIHPNIEISLKIKRGNKILNKNITPEAVAIKDSLGNESKIGRLGVMFAPPKIQKLSLADSIIKSLKETYKLCKLTLKAVKQMILRERSTKELGGPIKIARYAGASMENGPSMMIYFIALLSINIGLINILPIPPLDGGHLLFYATEAAFGKKISGYLRKYTLKIGFALLLTLMLLVIINDIIYF